MVIDQRKEEREGEGGKKEGSKNPPIFLVTMLGPAYTFRPSVPWGHRRCRKVECLSPFHPLTKSHRCIFAVARARWGILTPKQMQE